MPAMQAHGDETWDLDSEGESESDDSSNESLAGVRLKSDQKAGAKELRTPTKTTAINVPSTKGVPTITPPSMVAGDSEPDSEDDEDSNPIIPSRPLLSCTSTKPATKPSLAVSQVAMRLPPAEAAPKSSKALILYLRQENAWLRSALSQLQEEAERTVSQQESGDHSTLDFAHLLELAREFGQGPSEGCLQDCDDWYGDDASTLGPGTISMATPTSTPRGGNTQVAELQTQLSQSLQEVGKLKLELAARDKELAALRRDSTAAMQ